ncbi:MAG: hypothetical protein ACYS18_09525 [Planctomycetota bacterium]|jgi:hypothetical protein
MEDLTLWEKINQFVDDMSLEMVALCAAIALIICVVVICRKVTA